MTDGMLGGLFIRSVRVDGKPLETYVSRLPAVRQLAEQELVLRSPVTFFAGENGSGKSTLLEAIAVAYGFNAEGGSRNFSFATCASHSGLHRHVRLVRGAKRPRDGYFLRAESFYNVASYIDELDRVAASAPPLKDSYGGKSLHEQSHGESFVALIQNRFGGQGLYILDEPESALSPARQLTVLALIYRLAQEGAQFIIATHSPLLLACPGADIYVLDGRGLTLTDYRDTEHYNLTRHFLENPERMLRYVLED